MLLKDKVAIVTGAGSGMGRAVATGYAAEGARVVVADIDVEAANATVKEIAENGGTAEALRLDVSDPGDGAALVADVVTRYGRLDVLVNSAGVGLVKPLAELTPADWDRILGINTRGLFFLSQAAIGVMRSQGSGRIVNFASIAGRRGEALVAPYCASKAAVISLTQAFAEEGAKDGVTVNAIAPGIVQTPFWTQSDLQFAALLGKQPGEVFAETVAKIPLGRAEQPGDVVPLVVFLASEGASYITGQTYNIDGGITFS